MWSALAGLVIISTILLMTGLGLLVHYWYIVVPAVFVLWVLMLIPERKWREKRRRLREAKQRVCKSTPTETR